MSHTFSSLIPCPQIQQDLNSLFTTCDPTKIRESIKFLEFIRSADNTSGVIQSQISRGGGKTRDVEVTYTPRILESEVSTDTTQTCVSTNEAGMLSETYSLDCGDPGVHYSELFDLCTMADMCQENSLWIATRLQAIMDGLIRRMDTILMDQSTVLTGNFAVGETNVVANVKTVQTKFADGRPDTNMLEEVRFATRNAAYCGTPRVIGYSEVDKYFNRFEKGCCADSGLDLGEFSRNKNMIYLDDFRVEDSFGDNHFLTIAPGALQMIWFNKFMGAKGINVLDDDSFKQTVIRDPETSIPFDMVMKHDCGKVTLEVFLAFKLIGMPNDMFSNGDRLDGVVQVNEWVVTNP